MKVRQTVGMGAICLIPIGLFALSQKTNPGEYSYKLKTLIDLLLYTWLISSLASKILMIINKRFQPILLLSCASFITLVIAVDFFVEIIVHYQRPWFYEMLAVVWIFGWFLIDLNDLLQLQKQKYFPITTAE